MPLYELLLLIWCVPLDVQGALLLLNAGLYFIYVLKCPPNSISHTFLGWKLVVHIWIQGRTQGEGQGGPGPPLGSYPALDFQSFFSVKLCHLYLCSVCSKYFVMWEDRASLQHRTLLVIMYDNFCSGPPLEKILGAPLSGFKVSADILSQIKC